MCKHQYFLTYVLKKPTLPGRAAAKGSVVHKVLECMAHQSYHLARGHATYEDETFGETRVRRLDDDEIRELVVACYEHQKKLEPGAKWQDRFDLRDCIDWTFRCLRLSNGYFNPYEQIVLQPEQRFDIEVTDPWGRFRFDTPEGVKEGNLVLRGTMDLVVQDKEDPTHLEVIDYKTGQRRAWHLPDNHPEVEKTYEKLNWDTQLLVYQKAMRHLYPDAKQIDMTIVYVNAGGGFRLSFGDEHMEEIDRRLAEIFAEIKATTIPEIRRGQHCNFCSYGSRSRVDPKDRSEDTTCWKMAREIRSKGIDAVTWEHISFDDAGKYGTGGGRTEEPKAVSP